MFTDKEVKRLHQIIQGPFIKGPGCVTGEFNRFGIFRKGDKHLKPYRTFRGGPTYNLSYKDRHIYVRAVEKVEAIFGTHKDVVTLDEAKKAWEFWCSSEGIPIRRKKPKAEKKRNRKREPRFNEHYCRTHGCNKIILKRYTWCDKCKENRLKDNSPYKGGTVGGSTHVNEIIF